MLECLPEPILMMDLFWSFSDTEAESQYKNQRRTENSYPQKSITSMVQSLIFKLDLEDPHTG